MSPPAWLWIVFVLVASGGQVARNAMQRDLMGPLGAAGATSVRFLFGLPFALLFLPGVLLATGQAVPSLGVAAFAWTAAGALAQIFATGLMLAAMQRRSFVVATAYLKTEPVIVALFGLAFLGERLGVTASLAVAVATAGVMTMSLPRSWPRGVGDDASLLPALYGIGSAALFALSAVGYRAGILALGMSSFVPAATVTLALALTIQTVLIVIVLFATNRALLGALLRHWRPSLLAGFTGAAASQFWFLAFAIESAARVRTLALVEIVFAQIVSRRMFGQAATAREIVGMAAMAAGVIGLVRG